MSSNYNRDEMFGAVGVKMKKSYGLQQIKRFATNQRISKAKALKLKLL